MNIYLPQDDFWVNENKSIAQTLGLDDDPRFSIQLYTSLSHALFEVCLSLGDLIPHKKTISFYNRTGPNFENVAVALSKREFTLRSFSREEIVAPAFFGPAAKDLLMIVTSHDDTVTARLNDFSFLSESLKEKKHFAKAINDIQNRISTSSNEIEINELTQKLEELQSQAQKLDDEEKVIDYREQNAKAGYVYVISNIGSFGENIFKIGMTRRLDPLDRVYELGDASVPFPFDIHTMVFSDNAPSLERKIQDHFRNGQLNRINNRKEFFQADILEIERVIKENYDKVIEIIKTPPAEQYRESLLISN